MEQSALGINQDFFSDVMDYTSRITTGKYKGLTVDEVGQFDQDYLRWMSQNGTSFTEQIMEDLWKACMSLESNMITWDELN